MFHGGEISFFNGPGLRGGRHPLLVPEHSVRLSEVSGMREPQNVGASLGRVLAPAYSCMDLTGCRQVTVLPQGVLRSELGENVVLGWLECRAPPPRGCCLESTQIPRVRPCRVLISAVTTTSSVTSADSAVTERLRFRLRQSWVRIQCPACLSVKEEDKPQLTGLSRKFNAWGQEFTTVLLSSSDLGYRAGWACLTPWCPYSPVSVERTPVYVTSWWAWIPSILKRLFSEQTAVPGAEMVAPLALPGG